VLSVWGLGFSVVVFLVSGLRFMIQCLVFKVSGLRFSV